MAANGIPDKLVVGVDFGTTFSGIAAAYSTNSEVADEISVIKTWPGGSMTSDKVPTQIAYGPTETPGRDAQATSITDDDQSSSTVSFNRGDRLRWGFQLKPEEERIRCMKLFLEQGQEIPSFISETEMVHQMHNSGKDAVQVVSDFLAKLFEHTKETLLRRYGECFISNTKLEIILTVPAVWSDKAKDATMKAARLAGMGSEIKMISEPEAAAVYTLQAIQPNYLKEGDNFIVCDAGGGTVDLISYEIQRLGPLRIQESAEGTGACCGSEFLNVRFEEYVRDKIGAELFNNLRKQNPRSWMTAMGHFENFVKRNFDPIEGTDFNIPFPGAPDMPEAGLEDGYLTISSGAVGRIFSPIVTEIGRLVEDQMRRLHAAGKVVSGIILVGGFGQNNHLYKYLDCKFAYVINPPAYTEFASILAPTAARRIEVLQPVHAWTAVVRGAVLRGLEGDELVLARKARRHYGISHTSDFNEFKHPRSCRRWDRYEEKYKADDRVKWYISKGQTISSTNPVIFPFNWKVWPGDDATVSVQMIVCDYDNAPDSCEAGPWALTRRVCKLVVNLRTVPSRFWDQHTNPSGKIYQKLSFDVGMQMESGGLRFDMRVDDVVYGKITARFD